MQIHPFVDGNERVAFAVTDVFLRINGCRITGRSEAGYDFLIELLENGIFDMEHLVPWLQRNVSSGAPSCRDSPPARHSLRGQRRYQSH